MDKVRKVRVDAVVTCKLDRARQLIAEFQALRVARVCPITALQRSAAG